jgi:hypothetical protein
MSEKLDNKSEILYESQEYVEHLLEMIADQVIISQVGTESDDGRKYDYRNLALAAIVFGHYLTPQEEALKNEFHPSNKFYSLTNKDNQEPVKFDVELIASKFPSILEEIQNSNEYSRLLGYDQEGLDDLADTLKLKVEEKVETYQQLDKSGLVIKTKEFLEQNEDSNICYLGKVFNNYDEIIELSNELFSNGLGVVIKLDEGDNGSKFSSGNGVIIAKTIKDFDKLKSNIKERNLKNLKGVVQPYITNHGVASITSELNKKTGDYDILEAHIQTQTGEDGTVADGAIPLSTSESKKLIEDLWPDLKEIYKNVGMSGGQNMNFIKIDDEEIREKCVKLYGGKEENYLFVPMDPNVRPISGTKMALLAFLAQTGDSIDLQMENGFKYGGMECDPRLASNPALLFLAAEMVGLTAKKDVAITSYGKNTPEEIEKQFRNGETTRIKFVIGNRPSDAKEKFEELEFLLKSRPDEVLNEFRFKFNEEPYKIGHINPVDFYSKDISKEIGSQLKNILS